MHKFDSIDFWKGIILLGLNQATYKMALGKVLLEHAVHASSISWQDLSKSFLDTYSERLLGNSHPQQNNPARQTKMEQIVTSHKLGIISYDEAVQKVGDEGFNDVVKRFQKIGTNSTIVADMFYEFDFGKSITIKDDLNLIAANKFDDLIVELEARWSLLEGAFSLKHHNVQLANDIREIYLLSGNEKRNSLTTNIPFLQAYQGNCCFYCGSQLNEDNIHVDHVLPRQFINHDEIWNLVLSHDLCNLHKSDMLIGEHYFEKMVTRNENIVGSSHPWKYKIISILGSTPEARERKQRKHYNNAKIVLNSNYWEGSPDYNRETDPFFQKLITVINNPRLKR